MTENIKDGDTVEFKDEFGNTKTSVVTRLVPIGEYSKTEESVAIKGSYGSYVRTLSEVKKVSK